MSYSRSQLYEIKRRNELEGFQGLIDKPLIPKSHPQKKSSEVTNKVMEVTRSHPGWRHIRIAAQVKLEGYSVCPATVRNIWKKAEFADSAE